MKLFSLVKKELRIASKGFYFYVEVIMAVILLVVLLVIVPEEPNSTEKEFLFYDTTAEVRDAILQKYVESGDLKQIDDQEFKLKPAEITVYADVSDETETYEFTDSKTITLPAYQEIDSKTGKVAKTIYILPTLEDAVRLSYSEHYGAGRIYFDETGRDFYDVYLQGSETQRLKNVLYVLHNESMDTLRTQIDLQSVRYLDTHEVLNTRQNMIPLVVILMNGIMGIFVVAGYIFIDKGEGVIKALAVTTMRTWQYLLSKISTIMLIALISSLVVTIPVMGLQANYPLLILTVLCSTFFSVALGLLLGSFFDTITQAFGVYMIIMFALLLPALAYYIPGFNPVWVKFFPSHYMIEAAKESILANGDALYALLSCAGLLVFGIILFLLANYRYKKTITV